MLFSILGDFSLDVLIKDDLTEEKVYYAPRFWVYSPSWPLGLLSGTLGSLRAKTAMLTKKERNNWIDYKIQYSVTARKHALSW